MPAEEDMMEVDSSDSGSDNRTTMKDFILKQKEFNQRLQIEYCKKIQCQNMAMCKMRHHREIYA
jgi:hypothetical protein